MGKTHTAQLNFAAGKSKLNKDASSNFWIQTAVKTHLLLLPSEFLLKLQDGFYFSLNTTGRKEDKRIKQQHKFLK